MHISESPSVVNSMYFTFVVNELSSFLILIRRIYFCPGARLLISVVSSLHFSVNSTYSDDGSSTDVLR